ncbi:hypothetical protein ASC77_19645 [Nocardioides sp. Root1257]|nr:hypothetical protein ASC77_19645 [Nocardioides sp. Root1257]KRC45996.1 hypothetical protein ASE24_15575 [Nocardioides sp. Root224]
MSSRESYAAPLELGETIYAPTVGVVAESRDPAVPAGTIVTSPGGWSELSVARSDAVDVFDPRLGPASSALGIYGTSGFTAWAGLRQFGSIKPGSTLVVSAAAGAVGSLVAQIGRLRGCRVVGIAGGQEKCRLVEEEYGATACVDHRSSSMATDLATACPAGIDLYFDNVGGKVRDAVWSALTPGGTVVVCGLISEYNQDSPEPGPPWFRLLSQRLTVKGFLVRDHHGLRAEFLAEMSAWVDAGLITYREEFHDGIESAPRAFIEMLRGHNRGKTIVRLADDPR